MTTRNKGSLPLRVDLEGIHQGPSSMDYRGFTGKPSGRESTRIRTATAHCSLHGFLSGCLRKVYKPFNPTFIKILNFMQNQKVFFLDGKGLIKNAYGGQEDDSVGKSASYTSMKT